MASTNVCWRAWKSSSPRESRLRSNVDRPVDPEASDVGGLGEAEAPESGPAAGPWMLAEEWIRLAGPACQMSAADATKGFVGRKVLAKVSRTRPPLKPEAETLWAIESREVVAGSRVEP